MSHKVMQVVMIRAGPAAEQQNTEDLTQQLASELEANSHCDMRSLWKWACFQVGLRTSCLPQNCMQPNGLARSFCTARVQLQHCRHKCLVTVDHLPVILCAR